MAGRGKEQEQPGVGEEHWVELAARIHLGEINLETDRSLAEKRELERRMRDPDFVDKVRERANQLTKGSKPGLYTEKDLSRAKMHRKREEKVYWNQRGFLGQLDPEWETSEPGEGEGRVFSQDQEGYLDTWYVTTNKRPVIPKNTPFYPEVGDNKVFLREWIGLPVQRKGDPFINNDFFKTIVRTLVEQDMTGIFSEFDRQRGRGRISPELEQRIDWVKVEVSKLLDPNLPSRQRYPALSEVVREIVEMRNNNKR